MKDLKPQRRILIIDDEDIIRKCCKRTLGKTFIIEFAKCGVEGLKRLDENHFDLVLLDIKMPDMDGFEVLKLILQKWPQKKVIILTGFSTSENAMKAAKSGACYFIEKPFVPYELISAVKEAIGGK